MRRPPPRSTLFPSTTLFRSSSVPTTLPTAYDVYPLDGRHRINIIRSEERFSRNAETDLVCRLLLEKKKRTRASRSRLDVKGPELLGSRRTCPPLHPFFISIV